jgi:tetratricopeptide (TPR) repeat protein
MKEMQIPAQIREQTGRTILAGGADQEDIFRRAIQSDEELFLILCSAENDLKTIRSTELHTFLKLHPHWEYIFPLSRHVRAALNEFVLFNAARCISPAKNIGKFRAIMTTICDRMESIYSHPGGVAASIIGCLHTMYHYWNSITLKRKAQLAISVCLLLLILYPSFLRFKLRAPQIRKIVPNHLAIASTDWREMEKMVQRTLPSSAAFPATTNRLPALEKNGVMNTVFIHQDIDLTAIPLPNGANSAAAFSTFDTLFHTSGNGLQFWEITSRQRLEDLDQIISMLRVQLQAATGNIQEKIAKVGATLQELAKSEHLEIRTLSTAGAKHQPQSVSLFTELYQHGKSLQQQGNYEQAIAVYQKALELYRPATDQNLEYSIYFNIGLAHMMLAGPIHQRAAYEYLLLALNSIQKIYPDAAQELDQLFIDEHTDIMSYFAEKKPHPGIDLKIDILQKIAKYQRNIGAVLISLGHYQEALAHLEQAIKLDNKIYQHQFLAKNYLYQANAFWYLGDYQNALACYRKIFQLIPLIRQSDGVTTAKKVQLEALIGLGNCADEIGYPLHALKLYRLGESLLPNELLPIPAAALYQNMGQLFLNLHRSQKLGEAALESQPLGPPAVEYPPNPLENARFYFEKSYAFREKGNDPLLLAGTGHSLAEVALESHDFAKAFTLLEQARQYLLTSADFKGLAQNYYILATLLEKMRESNLPVDSAMIQMLLDSDTVWKREQVLHHESKQHHDLASPNYWPEILGRAYHYATFSNWLEGLNKILSLRGHLYAEQKDWEQALLDYHDALAMTEEMRAKFTCLEFSWQFLLSRIQLYKDTIDILKELDRQNDTAYFSDLIQQAEKRLQQSREDEKIRKYLEMLEKEILYL